MSCWKQNFVIALVVTNVITDTPSPQVLGGIDMVSYFLVSEKLQPPYFKTPALPKFTL
jgi:hypothetical protein